MQDYESGSNLAKAIAEPIRLQIIDILSGGERCACEILQNLAISQPTLSHHMKALTEAGWVTARKKSTWMYYALDSGAVDRLHQFLIQLTTSQTGAAIRTDCNLSGCCEPAATDPNLLNLPAIGE